MITWKWIVISNLNIKIEAEQLGYVLDNDINDLVDKKNKIESLQSIASRER